MYQNIQWKGGEYAKNLTSSYIIEDEFSIEALKITNGEYEELKGKIKQAIETAYDRTVKVYNSRKRKLIQGMEGKSLKIADFAGKSPTEVINESFSIVDKNTFVKNIIDIIEGNSDEKYAPIFTINYQKLKIFKISLLTPILNALTGGIYGIIEYFVNDPAFHGVVSQIGTHNSINHKTNRVNDKKLFSVKWENTPMQILHKFASDWFNKNATLVIVPKIKIED